MYAMSQANSQGAVEDVKNMVCIRGLVFRSTWFATGVGANTIDLSFEEECGLCMHVNSESGVRRLQARANPRYFGMMGDAEYLHP